MPVNLAAYRDLLVPGLIGIEAEYEEIKPQYQRIFETVKSNKTNERAVEMRTLTLPGVKGEGQAGSFDNDVRQMFVYNMEHQVLFQGYTITREAIEDNQYKDIFSEGNYGLKRVFRQAKDVYGANILNQANVFNSIVGGDGQALCSAAHPIDGGVIANRPVIDMDLSEGSLLSASMSIRANFKDAAGIKIYARPELLIVPVALWAVAERLLKSELRPGTSDNDVNALRNKSEGGIMDYMSYDFLTSNFAWFLKTDHRGLVHYARRKFETNMDTDQTTEQLIVTATERYSFGHRNWRSLYGNFPTS